MKQHQNLLQKRNPGNRIKGVRISGPMIYNARILLGRITKMHGYEGAVTIKLEKIFTENIPEMEVVFLEIEGKPVPFFISESDYPGANILRLKFDGYDSPEKIREFVGCRVFMTSGSGEDISTESYGNLSGYRVQLSDNTLIGKVIEIIENPGQWLLNIDTTSGKKILIPFHEDFVQKIDKRKRVIKMDLPEGLMEIN